MAKRKVLGCVNPCNCCTLYDAKGKILGYTLDTPNAIAYAMATNTKVSKAVAYYPLFGNSTTTREQVKDRFSWIVRDAEIHKPYLNWI